MALLSRFLFPEGTGSTTADTNATYSLITSAPSTAWAAGGGIKEEFTGVTGPNTSQSAWSMAFKFVMTSNPSAGDWVFSYNNANAQYLLMASSTRYLGLYTNSVGTNYGSTAVVAGGSVRRVVYAGDATSTLVYLDGVLNATLPGAISWNFGQSGSPPHLLLSGRNGSFGALLGAEFHDTKLDATGAAAVLPDANTDPGNSKMFFA